MHIWTIADLHLPFGNPAKNMEIFPGWDGYTTKIETHWKDLIQPEDLVLVPGDISWAKNLAAARADLEWIDALPGTKVLVRGNHDYWWASTAKMEAELPSSIRFIHNNAIHLPFKGGKVALVGSRLWDTAEYNFQEFVVFRENPKASAHSPSEEDAQKQFAKELERLKTSISGMDKQADIKIALTHYPPIGANLAPSAASALLEAAGIQKCVFGHLHSIRPGSLPFGSARGVEYIFASADYIRFVPIRVL